MVIRMEIYETILSKSTDDVFKHWFELCSNCKKTQEEVLLGIINNSKDTLFGKNHNFSNIKSVDDFRSEVPISEYLDFEEYIDEMAKGKEDILFDGLTEFFISTSGSTGKSKLIPESSKSNNAKKAVLLLRNTFLYKIFSEKMANNKRFMEFIKFKNFDINSISMEDMVNNVHIYSVTSTSPNKKTSGGIDVGFASGKTFDNSKYADRLAYPKELMGLGDGEAIIYLTMLFALRYDDVVFVTSNNSGRFYTRVKYAQNHAEELIDDLKNGTISEKLNLSANERKFFESLIKPDPKRAEELRDLLNKGREYFIPKYYWKYLFIGRFWLSGSVGVNVDKLRPYLPDDILYMDIGYGASEGKFNIPLEDNLASGTLAIASLFFEFIPVDNPDLILTADELEDNKEYEIILTTYSGLYRYPLHDIIKVRGFYGNTPNIEFISKSKEILNIAQEKLPAPQVIDYLKDYISSLGFNLRQSQIYPNNKKISYEIYVELEETSCEINWDDFAVDFDKLLRSKFELYDRNRMLGSLDQLKVYSMKQGWQNYLYDLREATGAPKSQVKLDSMIKEAPSDKWILNVKELI